MAGMAGLEPTNARVKVWCLTTWRHPNVWKWLCCDILYYSAEPEKENGVGEGIRTLDLQSHNLAR